MDELTIRLGFLLLGLVLGLILGYVARVAQDTKAIRHDLEDGAPNAESND